ncbi:MAG: hypothetical protein EBT77_03370 [Verrucomicrobia bacterium]|nr:hypothetical protein [Verrucomicrobiota bacterium]
MGAWAAAPKTKPGGPGEAEAGVDAVENHGIRLHLPGLLLHGFLHRLLVVPEKNLGGADQADDLVRFFRAVEEQGDFFPGFIGGGVGGGPTFGGSPLGVLGAGIRQDHQGGQGEQKEGAEA